MKSEEKAQIRKLLKERDTLAAEARSLGERVAALAEELVEAQGQKASVERELNTAERRLTDALYDDGGEVA